MSSRCIVLRTIPGEKTGTDQRMLELAIGYDAGGTSVVGGRTSRRGYSVQANTYSVVDYGYGSRCCSRRLGFSNPPDPRDDVMFSVLICPAARFNASALKKLGDELLGKLSGEYGTDAHATYLAYCAVRAVDRTQWVCADASDQQWLDEFYRLGRTVRPDTLQQPSLPDTIASIMDALGRGIGGAGAYVGGGEMTWKCPKPSGECRPRYPSRQDPDGSVVYDVGMEFPVNGPSGQHWRMIITYEADDTYTVRLTRRSTKTPGINRVTIDLLEMLDGSELKSTVEQMYDRNMLAHS